MHEQHSVCGIYFSLTRFSLVENEQAPNLSREIKSSGANENKKNSFVVVVVQLITSRIGNLTRLIFTLLNVMAIHMYGHTYSKSMDQPGKVASPARGQLNR